MLSHTIGDAHVSSEQAYGGATHMAAEVEPAGEAMEPGHAAHCVAETLAE